MIIGRKMKENIRIFKDMYKELKSYEQDATPINQSYKALTVRHKGDMSAQWKLTKNDGPAKMLFASVSVVLRKVKCFMFLLARLAMIVWSVSRVCLTWHVTIMTVLKESS
jgi:hypothetical protein